MPVRGSIVFTIYIERKTGSLKKEGECLRFSVVWPGKPYDDGCAMGRTQQCI